MSTREAASFSALEDAGREIILPKAVVPVALTAQAAETPPRKDLLEITGTPSVEIETIEMLFSRTNRYQNGR